ncbi:succinate--hydroxymethylglutarate CoA-transferase-like isoform X1 [Haliotis rufescens]|uniref:succinate--hydroxymethylglutarate CoA-transferase-like isoform X1 n=2 Tax=Haliotis rufescens TaxID=6454 RepID=UPI00201E7C0C|nr:succinate--hydroxymethylglutarate CoA-transferase-like isoform X1 [Haliotis rufescens]
MTGSQCSRIAQLVSTCGVQLLHRHNGGRCSFVTRKFLTTSSQQSERSSPLEGIRILDLTRVLAGPYCSMLLADLGADVIKVERPGAGDDSRSWGPPFKGTESAYFLSVNRNKKSIAVDLKKQKGVEIVQQLAGSCDVLIENYLPGKLGEMGLGYDEMKALVPQLVYCSITGYGQTGPYRSRAGYDAIAAGVGGLMNVTGPRDGDPCRLGVAMTDLSTGLYAFGAIMVALQHRQLTERGQHIDCNLLSTQVASLVNIASNYLNAGMEAKRYGTAHESIVPYQAFKTKDGGYFMVGAGNDKQFQLLCQRMELPELLEDERFQDNKVRVANRDILLPLLGHRFETKTTSQWMQVLEGSGIPYGPINNIQQVFSDPQVVHNGMIQELQHPTAGTIRLPGPAVRYSESQTVVPRPPPTLGQHTQEVLQGILGYSDRQLKHLIESGVVQ